MDISVISITIYVIDLKLSVCILMFFLREACLKLLIQFLVIILCQKTGNFLSFLTLEISKFHKMKTRT